MSALWSSQRAPRALGARDWAAAILVTWLVPLVLSLPVIGIHQVLFHIVPDAAVPELRMFSYYLATALIISPAFSWIGLLFLVPVVVLLVARGWFGWLSALLAGALTGSLATAIMGGPGSVVGLIFGAGAGIILRAALQIRRPDLF